MTQSSSVSGFSRTGASNFVPRKGLIMDSRNRKRLWTRNCILFILPSYSRCTDTPRRVWRYWLKIGPYIGNFYFKVGFSIFACYSTYIKWKEKKWNFEWYSRVNCWHVASPTPYVKENAKSKKKNYSTHINKEKIPIQKMTIELELFRFFFFFFFSL